MSLKSVWAKRSIDAAIAKEAWRAETYARLRKLRLEKTNDLLLKQGILTPEERRKMLTDFIGTAKPVDTSKL